MLQQKIFKKVYGSVKKFLLQSVLKNAVWDLRKY